MSSVADKLLRLAKNVQIVYNTGRTKGYRQGYAQGFEVGKAEVIVSSDAYEEGRIAERNAFWETNQEGGKRAHYTNAYSYMGYDDTNFNPIYPIAPTNSNGIANIFYYNNAITNTKVDIIVTNASARQAFKFCRNMQTVPYIEFTNCTDFYHIAEQCNSLSYIRVGGEIDKSIDFKSCPLDLESAKSVLLHLKNFNTVEDESIWGTVSVLFNSAVWAKLDAEGSDVPETEYVSWREFAYMRGWQV